jgi:hypothetical protein
MEFEPLKPHKLPEEEEPTPSTGLKVIVLILLVILLVIGILLPVKLVPNALSTVGTKLSSWFSKDKVVILTTDKSPIATGEPFTISWTHAPKTDGTYALQYTCTAGLQFQITITEPYETLPCGANFYFSTNSPSLTLVPVSTALRVADTQMSLSYLENNASTTKTLATIRISINNQIATGTAATSTPTQATTTVPVKPTPTKPATTTPVTNYPATTTATTTKPSTPKPTTPVTPSTPTKNTQPTITRTYRTSNPYGHPDLIVRIISTGYLTDNAEYIPSQYIYGGQRAAFRFIVTNIGDKNSGMWDFNASLPTVFHPTYIAHNRPNLGPGDSILYTLGFDDINQNPQNTVSVTVDPGQFTGDINFSNNTAATTITTLGTNY